MNMMKKSWIRYAGLTLGTAIALTAVTQIQLVQFKKYCSNAILWRLSLRVFPPSEHMLPAGVYGARTFQAANGFGLIPNSETVFVAVGPDGWSGRRLPEAPADGRL